jgi:uncharacterized protein (TIRG00374 family)
LLAIYFIARQMNPAAFVHALKQARYIYIAPSALLLLVGLVTRAWRWRILLGDALPIGRAFSIMNVAYLVNGVLPLRIGEVARVYLATRATPPVPVFKTASTIIVERLLDLLGVSLMVVLALGLGPVPEVIRRSAIVSGIIVVSGFSLLVMLAGRRELAQRWLVRLTSGRVASSAQQRLSNWLDHFLDGLQPLTHWPTLIAAVGWTVLSWAASALAGYILMFTFFEEASLPATLLYIAAAAFVIAVPAMPGNVGPYEGAIVLAISALGYGEPFERALAFAVLVHGLNLLIHASTGVIGFFREGLTLQQLSQGVRTLNPSQLGTPNPL